nr:pyridoxamine 5'-phosphate oxidase family protein [Microvirga antarctica]
MPDLETLYGTAAEASRVKEVDRIVPVYAAFIAAAPFVSLATSGPSGLDCSPRGDGPGFVHVADERTLLMPDRRGNNRLDSLRNIVEDPRVALLFLIPGIGETLRVNGRATISTNPALLARFAVGETLPRTVLVVSVESVFFQCARAILRSHLWDPAHHVPRGALPSAGEMLAALSESRLGGAEYDRALPERVRNTLY